MDLQYLLMLQQFRNTAGSFLTPLMLLVSDLASIGSVVICIVIYWAADRSLGYWVMTNCISGLILNNALKLTACIYRPWIRCPALTPPPKALKSATGYSFPSGHTQLAASALGSLAVKLRQKYRPAALLCILLILLTAFSRNYLGVHTPQDVVVSLILAALLIKVNSVLFEKIRQDNAALYRAIAAGCIFCLLCVLYYHFKPYPMEYVNGALTVDPSEMKTDGYSVAGAGLGFFAGAFLETRYVRFSTDGSFLRRAVRVLCGLPFAALMLLVAKKPMYALLGRSAGHFFLYLILILYAVFIYPALFTFVRRKQEAAAVTKEPC